MGAAIILALKEGKKRHGELRRELEAVSQKMLIRTLRNLERTAVSLGLRGTASAKFAEWSFHALG